MTEIVLATKNPHKILEIKKIIGSEDIVLIPYIQFINIEIPELNETLFENSLMKAKIVYKLTNKPTLADDSGLFIEKLNGAPGVFSSRYAKDDKERIKRVLSELGKSKNRKAKFCAVFVYYYAPEKYVVFEGEVQGRIASKPKGENGFGYDPIFIPDGFKKTFAELGPEIKNRISHRAKALRKFKKYLFLDHFYEKPTH
ncbi:MAG: RdgB/HAM1 family non-canonical purine NTP pyrophosphatase [bacterium]